MTVPSREGDTLTPVHRTVTQEQVEAYARAARDFNPIHLDEEFARGTQFGRRIAHGMLILALISEMLSRAYGERWASGGSLKVRFKAPVFPGETVQTFGRVTGTREGDGGAVSVSLEVGCLKEDGTEAISGQAQVPLNVNHATGNS